MAAALAAGLTGCATAGPGAGPPGAAAAAGARWVRTVEGIPVADSSGRPYAFPFLGGFDVPRPQLVDEDGDGDLDLFVQELSGEVMFFEQVGSPARRAGKGQDPGGASAAEASGGGPPDARAAAGAGGVARHRFAWRSDRYRGLDVGEWYRFADLDGDGDHDLLAEQPHSYVRYYRDDGTTGEPDFVLAADSLRDTRGEPLFSDRQNIPNVGDLDCDDTPDLLLGRLDGTVTRYELAEDGGPEGGDGHPGDTGDAGEPGEAGGGGGAAAETGHREAPRFRHVTDRFQGIEIVNQLMSLHGANSLVLVDRDGDGDLDLFWGDYFEPGLLYIENTGSCRDPYLGNPPRPFPDNDPLETSGYNAAAAGDVDGDGRLDVLVGVLGGAFDPTRTAADNLYHLEGTDGGFALRSRRYLDGVDVGSESAPALGDLDGDGDLDLLVANKIDPEEGRTSLIHRFENTGSPEAPSFRQAAPLEIRGSYQYAPELGDLDDDGRLDLALGSFQGRVALWRGDGAGGFTPEDSVLVELTRGSHTVPALGDLDDDGDLDLMVGEASGTLNLYRNVGTPTAPRFELVSDEFGGIDVGRRSAPALTDLDGDGDLDLVVGSEAGGLRLFRNRGSPADARFEDEGRLGVDHRERASPVFADVDADGELELFSGSAAGGLLYFRTPQR